MAESAAPRSLGSQRGERKLATVVFADLTGSTALGATQDPERTQALLARFYDAMAEEITLAGGTVEKYAGDAVMAVFGVPGALEDHVERALHAALAMQRRAEEIFRDMAALRIGVNMGEVVAGAPREGSSFVTGDAVNAAARLEQAAEGGAILVGERAASVVAGAFEFGTPHRVEAKGFVGGLECRKLLRALTLMRPRGIPGLAPAFVGREEELARIQAALERARQRGRPELVTVVGEPGVGKTRLVRELWSWLGAEAPDALRRTGRCLPYGHARTYAPIAEIVKEHFGILDSDPPERVLARLGSRETLGLPLGIEVARDAHPMDARDRLHDTWIEFVEELAAEQPLVLHVEDLHWADEPLLGLLERMHLEVDAPVLLVATGRAEFLERSPTWGRGRTPAEWIWLEPFAADDVERWLAAIGVSESPAEVRELLDRAEGNPLFLEEVVATLVQQGVLRDDQWDASLLTAGVVIPDTVQAVIAARIDRLPDLEKAALQAASVIGRAFWPSAVRELIGAEPDFRVLEQADFVRRRSGSSLSGERELVIKHALTREVAYGSLTRRERAQLHARFATWLERRGGGRDEDAAALAHHYLEAVRPEHADLAWADEPERHEELRTSAVRWLRRAAELATSRYEIDDALALIDCALELEGARATRIELLIARALTLTYRFDTEGYRAALEEALALEPDAPVAAWIYARLAVTSLGRRYMWKEPPSLEIAEQWLEKAFELSEPGSAARAYALLAQALSKPLGHEAEADEARVIGQAVGDPYLVITSYEARANAAAQAGRHQEACEWTERALADIPERDRVGFTAVQTFEAAFVFARAGRLADARRFADQAAEVNAALGPHDQVHGVAAQLAVRSVLGEWEALSDLAARAETATGANTDFPCQFNWRNLLVCSLAQAHLGEEREARRLEELGRSIAVVAPPAEREPALLRLAILRGDEEEMRRILQLLPVAGDAFTIDAAAARLDALLALREWAPVEEEAGSYLGEESYTLPFALRALGVCRRDDELVREAASAFESMGLAWRAQETRALIS